jgi:hypothetical protein
MSSRPSVSKVGVLPAAAGGIPDKLWPFVGASWLGGVLPASGVLLVEANGILDRVAGMPCTGGEAVAEV